MITAITSKYRIGEVVRLTGVSIKRIRYAEANGQLPQPRTRRFMHHWYTAEDVRRICAWFNVPVPDEIDTEN